MKTLTILAVGPWYPANAFRFLIDAFERNGHRVVRIGPTYNDHYGIAWPDKDKIHPDFLLPRQAPLWNLNQFVDLCADTVGAPDVLIVSEETYQTDIVPTEKVPVVLISYDGWPENYARKELFKPTLAYSNHIGIRIHPLTELPQGWRYLPGAYAPWAHTNLQADRTYDFCLMATLYGQRESLCKGLIEKGFRVRFGTATTDQYVGIYNQSLCTLHNPQPGEVKWRFFEAAAMGTVNISWHTPLFDRLGYTAGIHYWPICAPEGISDDPWPTIDDLAVAVTTLKHERDLQHSLSHNAQWLTKERHSYFHRVETILTDLGMS